MAPPPPKIYKSEAELQADFWKWAWNTHPEAQHHMWAVPNDAVGRITTLEQQKKANLLKATGLLGGVWDLHLFWEGTLHIIETKLPGNYLTTTRIDSKGRKHYGQREWGERMATHGAQRHIYQTLQQGMDMYEGILAGQPAGTTTKKIL